MEITNCTQIDFLTIHESVHRFWDDDSILHIHHPVLVNEFADTSFVLKDGKTITAYLFGFFSQTKPVAYIHLVGVDRDYRNQGLGRKLYGHFEKIALQKGCEYLKAITTLTNSGSISYHKALGFEMTGGDVAGELRYVKNYSGPNNDRVVFMKKIS